MAATGDPAILITGGTGNLGRRIAGLLTAEGRAFRIAGRTRPATSQADDFATVDLESGDGVSAALAGVQTVIHCAGSGRRDGLKARTLVEAARAAGVRHLVFISVVGADVIPVVSDIDRGMFGYYAEKRAAELAIEQSGIPFSILRATQFHDLAFAAAKAMASLPIVPVPRGWRFQPIDADVVARRLVQLAVGEPAGLVPDLGGARVYGMDELVRGYLAAQGRRRPLLHVGTPGRAAKAFRDGANLTSHATTEGLSWEEFLRA